MPVVVVVSVVLVVLDEGSVRQASFCMTLITSGTADPIKQIVDKAIAAMTKYNDKGKCCSFEILPKTMVREFGNVW